MCVCVCVCMCVLEEKPLTLHPVEKVHDAICLQREVSDAN